jgi:hypothetical protein
MFFNGYELLGVVKTPSPVWGVGGWVGGPGVKLVLRQFLVYATAPKLKSRSAYSQLAVIIILSSSNFQVRGVIP